MLGCNKSNETTQRHDYELLDGCVRISPISAHGAQYLHTPHQKRMITTDPQIARARPPRQGVRVQQCTMICARDNSHNTKRATGKEGALHALFADSR
jgi:hypothetical protein